MNKLIVLILSSFLASCTSAQSSSDQSAALLPGASQVDTKYIALTYDDGPDAEVTARLLDVLEENDAKATFFVRGNLISSHGQLIRRMDAEGHELGNHTLTHARLTGLDGDALRAEIEGASAALQTVTGKAPAMLRPPRAAIDLEVKEVARANGLAIALFDIYPRDSMFWMSAEKISDAVVSEARDGGIVFLHDTSMRSADATALAIRELSAQGYRFVTLSELITRKGPIQPGAVYRNGYVAE